jgi:large subunit ribosomal protein L13
MDSPIMQTSHIAMQDVARSWYLVDAEGKTLGRLATRIARVLTGKHKPSYTPNADTGDFVVVVNAEKVHLTGKKWSDKVYYRHSQYPGGLRERTAGELRATRPTRVIEAAVRGMLPGNRLRAKRMARLRLFAGPKHAHAAQSPQPLKEV